MRIPLHQYRAVLGHCREQEERGVEACGILYGPTSRQDGITHIQRMENVHEHPRYRWQFDPQAQVDTWVDLDERGMRPWVIYHSHLDTDPVMSDDDERYALDPTIAHLVVSLSAGTSRLWRVVDGEVREEYVWIADDQGEQHPVEFQ